MRKTYLSETMVKWVIFAGVVATAFSCAQQKHDRLNGTTASGIHSASTTSSGSMGLIYDSVPSISTGGFQQALQAFVSSFMSPQYLGQVSGDPKSTTTGVDLDVAFARDSSGNIIQGSSYLKIRIFDNLVGQPNGQGGTNGSIDITFDANKFSASNQCRGTLTGNFNASSGILDVTATDCVGSIRLYGKLNSSGGVIDGSVTFHNTIYYPNTPTSVNGTLGAFRVSSSVLK